MHTTTTHTDDTAVLATPDLADELAAGRPYPLTDGTRAYDALGMREHLADLRAWWLDAAQSYVRQAEAGAPGALDDARRALAASRHYAPQAVA